MEDNLTIHNAEIKRISDSSISSCETNNVKNYEWYPKGVRLDLVIIFNPV